MISHENAWVRVCDFYSLPGISPQSLALQDRAGVSVTTLLTLMLSAVNGDGAVETSAVARIAELSEAYQTFVLRPLRQVRNRLKMWTRGPTRELLQGELKAERLEQQMVLDVLAEHHGRDTPEDPLADSARTVARYLSALGIRPDAELSQLLAHILTLALDEYDGLHVTRVLDRALREQEFS